MFRSVTFLRFLVAFLVCFLGTEWVPPAQAQEKRVALIIGNSDYVNTMPLINPTNDAERIAAALQRLGFQTILRTNLNQAGTRDVLREFAGTLQDADVALFYYAGHGLQVNGGNYLASVDAKLQSEADLHFETIDLQFVLDFMQHPDRTSLVILDACRDNPLSRRLARTMGQARGVSVGRGLARVESGLGSLVAFATAPGAYALDGEGSNSPFTKSLLKHLETPGLEIRQLLTRVRDDVYRSTGGKQIPWDNSSLRSDFYFVPAIAADLQSAATSEHDREAERIFWESIQGSRSEADFQEFLRLYPNSVFAGLAERRLAELGAQSEAKQQVAAEAPLQKPVSISQASSRRSAQLLAESWGRRRYQVRYAISGTGSGGSASSICSGSDGVRVGIWKAIDPRDSRIELNDQSADRDIYTITSRDFEIGSDLLAATDNDSTFLVEYKYNNGLGRGWCPIKHVDSNLIKSLFVNNPYYRDHEIVVYENFLTWFSGIEFIVGSVKISTTDVVNNCLTFIGIRGRNRIDGFYCRDIRSSIAQSDLESVLSRLKIEGVIG